MLPNDAPSQIKVTALTNYKIPSVSNLNRIVVIHILICKHNGTAIFD